MSVSIDPDRCSQCGGCIEVCPTGALGSDDSGTVILPAACADCDKCLGQCPSGALTPSV